MENNTRQGDMADQASGNNEVHIALKLKQTDAKILQAIEEALQRELEKIWSPEHLERLARTYWSFLSRFSLGLIRVLYSEDSREVVFLRRPFVLLRFRKPEYEFNADGGTVTWPINRGVLVARRGRGAASCASSVHRKPAEDGADEVTLVVSSEVVNFYPTIATRLSRWIYEQTQLRIHVIVTHAFLRSLANLELEPSRVGALRAAAEAAHQPSRSPVISRSFARSWRAVMRRTVPERERIEIDSVVAPRGAAVVHAVEQLAVGHARRREEDVVAGHEPVLVEHLVEVVARLERRFRSSSERGHSRPRICPPVHWIAAAASTPSGVPPIPNRRSTAESSVTAAAPPTRRRAGSAGCARRPRGSRACTPRGGRGRA